MNATSIKPQITYDEFLEIESKLDIRIGKILTSERIPKSKKLLKLSVDFGSFGIKTVVTNLGDLYEPECFSDLTMPFITNLKPSVMMGIESEAMILVGEKVDGDNSKLEFNNYSIGTVLL